MIRDEDAWKRTEWGTNHVRVQTFAAYLAA